MNAAQLNIYKAKMESVRARIIADTEAAIESMTYSVERLKANPENALISGALYAILLILTPCAPSIKPCAMLTN